MLSGHENNVHCLTISVNAIASAVFAFYGEQEQRDKMRDFIIVIITINSVSFIHFYLFFCI